jgi:hypothetical protein
VQKALEQASALRTKEGDYPAPLASALKAWGYGGKSSGGRQTLATMKYYGLIDVTGDGDSRKVKVSEIARRILLDQREDDTEKRRLIQQVGLMPSAHKAIYKAYPHGLASDGSVEHFLTFDQGFNPEAAKELLAQFKQTASFIQLYQPDNSLDKTHENGENPALDKERPDVKLGDRIQWTSNGVDQFRDGGIVLGFTEDGSWAYTDQGTSGVPINEVTVMESTAALKTPPEMPPHLLAALDRSREKDIERPGSRKAIFPISDGDVTLTFPEGITDAGLKRLKRYLEIFLDEQIEIAEKQ